MGYESRLYVVRKSCGDWAEVIAMINLCKVYKASDKMRRYPETNCFIYVGNEAVTEDAYGERLKEIPLDDAISIIKEAWRTDEDYDRYFIALELLTAFKNSDYKNVVVLHYGY